jgi:hypothetical protein
LQPQWRKVNKSQQDIHDWDKKMKETVSQVQDEIINDTKKAMRHFEEEGDQLVGPLSLSYSRFSSPTRSDAVGDSTPEPEQVLWKNDRGIFYKPLPNQSVLGNV